MKTIQMAITGQTTGRLNSLVNFFNLIFHNRKKVFP
jgi:hypothetical protein